MNRDRYCTLLNIVKELLLFLNGQARQVFGMTEWGERDTDSFRPLPLMRERERVDRIENCELNDPAHLCTFTLPHLSKKQFILKLLCVLILVCLFLM